MSDNTTNKRHKYTKEQLNTVLHNMSKKGVSIAKATRLMCNEYGLDYDENIGRRFREKVQALGKGKVPTLEQSDEFKKAKKKKHDGTKKRFLVTCAQSDTGVHKQFLGNIEAYADYIGAELLVIANRYKNPNSLEASKRLKGSEFWASEVQPYLTAAHHKLHKYLHVAGGLKIQPTAATPLTGLNGISGKASMIVGSPRVHLKSLPVLDGDPNKLLLTTGMCTVPNYTDTKVGFKSNHHHTYGFVVVECDGDMFHIRQVTANGGNGSFYDLIYHVNSGKVEKSQEPKEAVILGDIHYKETDMEVFDISKSMLKLFTPKKTILHDLFSGYSINHHERNNPVILMQKEQSGDLDLQGEIDGMLDFLQDHLLAYNPILTRGNHEVFLDTFIINVDWRKENNKATYLKLANKLAEGKATKGLIPCLIEERFGGKVVCLSINDSVKVKGWEVGQHGHKNSNGSRPSPTSFKNMNTKICSGHTHTHHREDGYACVGTNTHKRLGYNESWSTWTQGNAVIHPDGKLQLINITNNRYTTLYK